MTLPTPKLRLPEGVDAACFLREFWQKKPLLMRQALSANSFPVTPDELAGLACEPDIESRLIIERSPLDWQVRHGPFDENDFAGLPDSPWTLLVQDVDKFLPDVAGLIDAFDFVPAWRIDDIMISYANDQGGVGPHTDAYDVFLMQASGRRRWRLSYREYNENELIPGLEQRILAKFDTDDDWLLEPGDILYLPPGIAHWGTAEGDCMTYSLGFRAPSQRELAGDWFQHLVSLAGDTRLAEANDLSADNLTELTPGILRNVGKLLKDMQVAPPAVLNRWFGCHVTEPKPQFEIAPPNHAWGRTDLDDWIAQGRPLIRNPAARIAWSTNPDGSISLFVQGEPRDLPGALRGPVQYIAGRRQLAASTLQELLDGDIETPALLLELVNEGILEAIRDESAQ